MKVINVRLYVVVDNEVVRLYKSDELSYNMLFTHGILNEFPTAKLYECWFSSVIGPKSVWYQARFVGPDKQRQDYGINQEDLPECIRMQLLLGTE